VDTVYAYRFLKLLSLPWEEWTAYELGIIDDKGAKLKKHLIGNDEKNAYTYFHRIVRKLKILLHKIPGGKSMMGKAAAAYVLLREDLVKRGADAEQLDEVFAQYLDESEMIDVDVSVAMKILINEDALATGDVAVVPTPLITDPDGTAFGMSYFDCDADTYQKCVHGKRKTGRWQSYLGDDERAGGIKNWAKLNNKDGIMIKDISSGSYTVLRRPAGPGRWDPKH
jgi:hypothetical protein